MRWVTCVDCKKVLNYTSVDSSNEAALRLGIVERAMCECGVCYEATNEVDVGNGFVCECNSHVPYEVKVINGDGKTRKVAECCGIIRYAR